MRAMMLGPKDTALGKSLWVVDCDFHELVDIPRSKPGCMENARFRAELLDQMRWDAGWFGGIHSVQEIVDLVKSGWPEGGQRAMELRRKVDGKVPPPESVKRQPCWREDGEDLSVDRWLGGETEFWRRAVRTSRMQPRTIAITVNFGGNAERSAEELFWGGATSAVLADLLEEAGYGCEIYATSGTMYSGWYGVSRVCAKRAGESLRPDNLALVTGHAGLFRVIEFMMGEIAPWSVGWGRGSNINAAPIVKALEDEDQIERSEMVLPLVYNEQSAIKALTAALAMLLPAQV